MNNPQVTIVLYDIENTAYNGRIEYFRVGSFSNYASINIAVDMIVTLNQWVLKQTKE